MSPPGSRSAAQDYQPQTPGRSEEIEQAVEMMPKAERPIFYTGGGVINSGPRASEAAARAGAELTGFPVTSTLMGLGAFPASGKQWLGMLGMHGTYEANLAMHDCDVMINIGARFDDRITGRSTPSRPARRRSTSTSIRPRSTRTSASTCRSSAMRVLEDSEGALARAARKPTRRLKAWWKQIDGWRARNCLAYAAEHDVIKPQYAIERLYAS
jgi:acetolactate synthase-1/2/3 large subunit